MCTNVITKIIIKNLFSNQIVIGIIYEKTKALISGEKCLINQYSDNQDFYSQHFTSDSSPVSFLINCSNLNFSLKEI